MGKFGNKMVLFGSRVDSTSWQAIIQANSETLMAIQLFW
jgi:hypothetical protein